MALGTPTNLTSGGNATASASDTTASFTPTANALVIAVSSACRASSTPTTIAISSTHTGLVGSWTEITIRNSGGTAKQSLFYRMAGGSPSAGTLTFTYSGASNPTRKSWIVDEITGVDTTTPILQSTTNQTTGTTLTATLASAVLTGNKSYGSVVSIGAASITPGTGETEIIEATSTGTAAARSQTEHGTDANLDWSGLSATVGSVCVGAEIQLAYSTSTQTETGKARVEKSVSQTQTGKSRIEKAVAQTITAKARLTGTTTQNATGKARVEKSATQTSTGKARVTVSTTKTATGKARVTATTTQAITAKSRITATTTTTKTATGKARLEKSATQTATGIARIEKSASQTEQGTSRIEKSVTQTESGIARVEKSVSQTEAGTARIEKSASQTETGLARITVSTGQTETGLSRIEKAVTQLITGLSRITAIGTALETGLSRITATTLQVIAGVANILNTTARTITGTASIATSTDVNQTIQGVARISAPESQGGLEKHILLTTPQTSQELSTAGAAILRTNGEPSTVL